MTEPGDAFWGAIVDRSSILRASTNQRSNRDSIGSYSSSSTHVGGLVLFREGNEHLCKSKGVFGER